MTQTLDPRLYDGTDQPGVRVLTNNGYLAFFVNRAYVDSNPAVHIPLAATKTGFAAVKFVQQSSGIVDVNLTAQTAGVAADAITLTVDVYTDAVAGTPLTLPANAIAQGAAGTIAGNVYIDNSGAGIAPSAGATAVHTVTAPSQTLGTAAANLQLEFDGLVAGAPGAAVGKTIYIVFSVTNSVGARAISQLTIGAFEMP